MLTMFYWGLPCFLYLIGVFMLVSYRKNLLSMLLTLEYIVLNLLFIYLNLMNVSSFFSMMLLTFSVCEGALGLLILVSMICTHGNDYFQSFNVLQC